MGCVSLGRESCRQERSSMTAATAVFVVHLVRAAALNMWIGISHAGYSFQEELPIFLLIFLLPAVVAVFVNWKFLSARRRWAR